MIVFAKLCKTVKLAYLYPSGFVYPRLAGPVNQSAFSCELPSDWSTEGFPLCQESSDWSTPGDETKVMRTHTWDDINYKHKCGNICRPGK